jgi:hypothetical protein
MDWVAVVFWPLVVAIVSGLIVLYVSTLAPKWRVQPKDRVLSEWQIGRLIAILLPHRCQKITILTSAGDETGRYANQFKKILRKAGWSVAGPLQAPSDQHAMDIQLSIYAGYASNIATVPQPFWAIRTALDQTNVKSRKLFILDPDVPVDEIVLWVGAKSADDVEHGNYLPLGVGSTLRQTLWDRLIQKHKQPTAMELGCVSLVPSA